MKKTLLSLLLASVATSAFSYTLYKSDNASLSFGGELRGATTTWKPEHKADGVLQSKLNASFNQARTRLWLGGNITDGKLRFSFYARMQHVFFYSSREVSSYTNGVYTGKSKTGNHKREGFTLNNASVSLGYDKYGTLRYGKFATLSDYRMGDNSWFFTNRDNFYNHLGFTAATVATSYDSSFQYTNKYENYFYGVSWGKTNDSSTQQRKQLSFLVDYTFQDLGNLQFVYSDTQTTNKNAAIRKTRQYHTYDLTWSQKITPVLYYSVGATYEKSKFHLSASNQYQKNNAWSLAGTLNYDMNQYFRPYVALSYVHAETKYTGNADKEQANVLQTLLGFSSVLYKKDNLEALFFLEGGYAKARKDVTTSGVKVENDYNSTAYATGLRFRF
ncbi:hypothetical protein CKF54_02120 [Psittacicella hinzii]|uniref:Porin n=1 Tax=Psittacicella hinzii TaxID=2028575 RepID=A0A3A1YC29_9GAMM|nr:hypothetical protein [Psittacicella hinzii]RIY33774.1 hypothetical protein CKF54_02120 [Psittacicella hinzii]